MTVIPNGIGPVVLNRATMPDIRREIGVGPEDVFILSVGRLVYQKGHEYLIEAIGILGSALPRIQVAICGEGPLRRQLEAQIRRLGLDASVRLLGNRMDIDHYLASADIFALPSRWEGLPVALLEAMQHGLPVVATAVEGVEEVVQDDVQGLLVPAEDSRALAEALRLLVIDPGRRAQMGGAASARIRQAYTIDIMCGKYLALMNTLLAKTDRR
jgi:glycosyltransferase involved in cell wall biosynthesis